MSPVADFQKAVLDWFQRHGRKHLPWQLKASPYTVWLSEIMLQQTQVCTVVNYFLRFLERFPTLSDLASAPLDQVMTLWSGLGYYRRAFHLHQAAKHIMHTHSGEFPNTLEGLMGLPGIGRSTAGAILALGFRKKASILDGNVQRVLARHHGILGWPGESKTKHRLWELAETLTPEGEEVAAYTQAMMDIGALICTKKNPHCGVCPISNTCFAYRHQQTQTLPQPRPKKIVPKKTIVFLVLLNPKMNPKNHRVFLIKRPATGLWAHLWSFPEHPHDESMDSIHAFYEKIYQLKIQDVVLWPTFKHNLTHFRLTIQPIHASVQPDRRRRSNASTSGEIGLHQWVTLDQASRLGLSKPTQYLLTQLRTS